VALSGLRCTLLPLQGESAHGTGQTFPAPLIDALLVEEVSARGGPGERILHIHQADHALLLVLPRARVQRVQHGGHEVVKSTDVAHHDGRLVDEPGPPPQEYPAADGEGDADEQHGGQRGHHHQLADAFPAHLVKLVYGISDVE
jgi:hypothetical protein